MSLAVSVEDVTPDLIRVRHYIANFYIWHTGGAWVLIDAGMAGADDVVARIAADRFGGAGPEAIVLTHGHFDHIGAFPAILERWPAPVYAHPAELPYLTGQAAYPPPDPSVGKGLMAMMSFVFPNDPIDLGDRVQPLPEDGSVPGMAGWRWIFTPGHAPGHVSFFQTAGRLLVAGDAFVTTKQESVYSALTQKREINGPPAYFTPDWIAARRSIERLAELRPELAVTGHGEPFAGRELADGLSALLADFDDRVLPAQGRYVPDGHHT